MIREYKDFIDVICEKFDGAISQLQVVSWLENFDEVDWKKALIVLNAFEYYSSKQILGEFEKGLSTIINESGKGKKIKVIAVGKLGKSGSAMIYYLKKTPSFKSKNIEIFEGLNFEDINSSDTIVLVDDFSGTGKSIIGFFENLMRDYEKPSIVYALTVSYMEKARVALEAHGIIIIGIARNAAFESRGSVFGYYPRMIAIREFCFKYGNKIYPESEYKKNPKKIHPLGYSNSQALVGFEHSIPNNTIPIIWADARVADSTQRWVPLFPRRGNIIIERDDEFQSQQRYWSSIYFKLDLNSRWISMEERYSRESVQLLSFIMLKRKGKSEMYISQLIGIGSARYEDILSYGRSKDIFDIDGELTPQAIKIIDEVRKRIKFYASKENQLVIDEDILYIPKTFGGRS